MSKTSHRILAHEKGKVLMFLLRKCEVNSIVNMDRIIYMVMQENNQGFVQLNAKSLESFVMVRGGRIASDIGL
jgi:hypothetical protein